MTNKKRWFSRTAHAVARNRLLAVLSLHTILCPAVAFSQDAELLFLPVGASGIEGIDWYLGPAENEITLLRGDQYVRSEVYLRNFAPYLVDLYSIEIDCAVEGVPEDNVVSAYVEACPDDADYNHDHCYGIDTARADWLFAAYPSGSVYRLNPSVVSCSNRGMTCGAYPINLLESDNGLSRYLATFSHYVSAGFPGTFSVSIKSGFHTSIRGQQGYLDFEPPQFAITVPTGRCCGANVGAPSKCVDEVTADTCDGLGGVFTESSTCLGVDSAPVDGIDDACHVCGADNDCDDANLCTTDTCTGGLCTHVDATPVRMCCDAHSGTTAVLDDGDICTQDLCRSDGSVLHVPQHGEGDCCNPVDGSIQPIDDGNLCTVDECHPDGSVTHVGDPACQSPVSMWLVPIRAEGLEGVDWYLGPGEREITLRNGGRAVELELRLSGFGPSQLGAYQANADCDRFLASQHGTLSGISLSCPNFGEFGLDFCTGVDGTRDDWVFAGLNALGICQTANACPNGLPGDFACGGYVINLNAATDDGSLYYGATFGYEVSTDARGAFFPAIAIEDDNYSFLSTPDLFHIPIEFSHPATITISTGVCDIDGACSCMSRGDCEAAGGEFSEQAELCELDFDGDGATDFCDDDIDNDGFANLVDYCDYSVAGAPLGNQGQHISDVNSDCRVDSADLVFLVDCLNQGGPDAEWDAGASCLTHFDRDANQRIELYDVGKFMTDLSGAGHNGLQ